MLIHFTVFEHQEEDLPKKKEAEPVLVRLQRVSDARHLDDFSVIKTLRARMSSQKKRVAEEEATSRKWVLAYACFRQLKKILPLFLAAGISKTP